MKLDLELIKYIEELDIEINRLIKDKHYTHNDALISGATLNTLIDVQVDLKGLLGIPEND